jgi:hypothetical protein
VRRFIPILFLVVLGWVPGLFAADTFRLTNGETLVGEMLVASANETGVQIKIGDGKYERVPWQSFSQDDLKKMVTNAKLKELVEPYIEISQEERIRRTDPNPKDPERFERPAKQSLLGAFFGSGLGMVVLGLLYLANLYAAFEIALFRARPIPLVCGVSALFPIFGPIAFLSMPTRLPARDEAEPPLPVEPVAETADVNPMLADGAAHPAGLTIHHEEKAKADIPDPIVFPRGQFTFNRRFFETKFPGFFGTIKRDAEKDLILQFKTGHGEFIAHRITRISASDLHVEVHKGHANEEVSIAFADIKEIQQKHSKAK